MRRTTAKRIGGALASTAVALSGAAVLGGANPAQTTGGGTYSFVLGNFYQATGGEQDQCPALADGGVETFFSGLPAEDKAKFADPAKPNEISPEKRAALQRLMAQRLGFKVIVPSRGAKLPAGMQPGVQPTPEQALEIASLNGFPKGRGKLAFQNKIIAYSSCTNPEDFPQLATGHRTYDGAVGAGMNLDGKVGPRDFTGPAGEKGVDNRLWRATGCIKAMRESADPANARKTFMSALAPTLITLEGVDDLRNDPDVTVIVRASTDPVTKDARGGVAARGTFTIDPDPRYSSRGKGRIVDGVLLTDPMDLTLAYKEQILDAPRQFRGARIRATLNADGTIDGGVYGYYTLDSYYNSVEQMTQAGADSNQLSCPGVRKAIDALADGYRDPKSKKFTAISSAFNFYGARAFAVDAPAGAKP